MDYDPNAKVHQLKHDFGEYGLSVLAAFNTVDPLGVYYGDDCNPDEYANYARRFMYHRMHEGTIYDAVKASFWRSQIEYDERIKDSWVTDDKIKEIADLIDGLII